MEAQLKRKCDIVNNVSQTTEIYVNPPTCCSAESVQKQFWLHGDIHPSFCGAHQEQAELMQS